MTAAPAPAAVDLRFLPKLLLQHDWSPQEVLEDVQTAFLQAVRQRQVHACVSPGGDGLAVALGRRLVVLHGLASGSPPSVDFVSAVDAPGEALTALAWLASSGGGASSGGQPSADECILAGTSAGFLQLHSASSGALLLRQQLHLSPAAAAAVRWRGSGSDPSDLSEDVTLTFADAVVRIPAWEIWAAVRWHVGGARGGGGGSGGGGWWGGGGSGGGGGLAAAAAAAAGHHHQLSFSKFQLPKGAGPRSHAVCLGPPPPSLYAALAGGKVAEQEARRLRVLTAGSAPPLAAYEGEEVTSQGVLSLVSDLASSAAQSLLGAAKSYVPGPAAAAGRSLLRGLRRGGGSGGSGGGGGVPDAQQQQQGAAGGAGGGRAGGRDKIPGEPATLAAAVWDEKRSITQMALSPCGRLAACCDSLGRVLLVDTSQTLVVRMLKGYRDAQVAWLVCNSSSSSSGGNGAPPLPLGRAHRQAVAGSSWSSLEGGSSCHSVGGSAADLAALLPGEQQHAQQHAQSATELERRQPQQQQEDEVRGQGGADAAGPASAVASQRQEREREQVLPAALPVGCCRHLLVTYAPRRAVVEAWDPHTLDRLASVRCSVPLGLLLQQPARRQTGGGVGGSGSGGGAHACNRCLLLDASSSTLTDLTEALTAAL